MAPRRRSCPPLHPIPIDQDFPEWGYRDDYWRDYISQPPLSFMLHYWMTRAIPTADPVLLGRLLAEALIAMGVLVSGALLQDVFGFGATLVGLSSLIWGQPFLVWFIDGYYSTTPAMVCQLVLVSWCLRLFTRELVGEREGIPWRTRKRDLLIVSLLAYLGTFSEWIALSGNAVAVLAFVILGLALSVRKSSGARKAYAIALALAGGSVAAESTTVLLYGTRIGFAFYWHGFVSRVNERTGPSQEGFLPYTRVLIQQMERSWPASMLAVLVIMALVVCVYAGVTLIKGRLRSRATDGTLLLLAMVLGARPSNAPRAPSSALRAG